MKTKRFVKKLPLRYGFVFKDPKDANEFYQFINVKLSGYREWKDANLPFQVEETNFYLSFYEVEKTTKTLNLLPIIIDERLKDKGYDPLLSEYHNSRKGQWYLLLTVSDDALLDGLSPKHPRYKALISYLEDLRKEYLNTNNYIDQFFQK